MRLLQTSIMKRLSCRLLSKTKLQSEKTNPFQSTSEARSSIPAFTSCTELPETALGRVLIPDKLRLQFMNKRVNMGFPCEAVTQLEREAGNNLNGSTRAGFFHTV